MEIAWNRLVWPQSSNLSRPNLSRLVWPQSCPPIFPLCEQGTDKKWGCDQKRKSLALLLGVAPIFVPIFVLSVAEQLFLAHAGMRPLVAGCGKEEPDGLLERPQIELASSLPVLSQGIVTNAS